ncbi:MAG: RNA polymerase sigma factor [Deltaproteobacteria bacterium]|nr:RNA polymerase sigma factor [Deltaproteobacteria bacterium]
MPGPSEDAESPSVPDEQLAAEAVRGGRAALEELVQRHRAWLYNLALRFLWEPRDAEDAVQEILLRIVTRLATFRGESRFRTWAYRIAVNHLLGARRSRAEEAVRSFECYGEYLRAAQTSEPSAPGSPEDRLLVEEAKIGCTMGMLLCLDREQRMVFVLGEIFEVSDALGSELLGLSRDNFRQRLARARAQLERFLRSECGLVDPSNPCRCARKTAAFIRDGIVDPDNLRFARAHVGLVRSVAPARAQALGDISESCARTLYREQPFLEPSALTGQLRELLRSPHPGEVKP